MKKFSIILFSLILLLPPAAGAAYKIYLRNGSAISGVGSYEKQGEDILIQFGGGSMGIKAKDVLKIEETGAPEKDFRSTSGIESREEAPPPAVASPPDRTGRVIDLKGELDSLNAELGTVEEDEARLKTSIDQKKMSRPRYTTLQLRQLEAELAPLQQELATVQQRKSGLTQRKAQVESELKSLE
ncbi:MAG TPA: hypothetical protein VEI96_09075 [Thermodesulfovibrionales bacterium]|nr:hypothetical protein [Thermodesulfovibrionales bacterium]